MHVYIPLSRAYMCMFKLKKRVYKNHADLVKHSKYHKNQIATTWFTRVLHLNIKRMQQNVNAKHPFVSIFTIICIRLIIGTVSSTTSKSLFFSSSNGAANSVIFHFAHVPFQSNQYTCRLIYIKETILYPSNAQPQFVWYNMCINT